MIIPQKHKCYLLALLIAVSCAGPAYVTPEELTMYFKSADHGLYQFSQVNDMKIEVTYRPTDLLVHQELTNTKADVAVVEKLRKKYSSYYYFILSISKNNKEALHQSASMGQYSELVQAMSFRMPSYVTLTTSEYDTVPVGDFMLNRTYGMSTSTDILFAFNKEKTKNKKWVQFNLNEFGMGTGNQRFRFRIDDLEEVPRIYVP